MSHPIFDLRKLFGLERREVAAPPSVSEIANGEGEKSERSMTINSPAFIEALLGLQVVAGVKLSEQRLLGISAFWAAVRVIARGIATLPGCVVIRRENGTVEKVTGHPVGKLLKGRLHPLMTRFDVFQGILANAMLGNGYALIHRDLETRRPVSLELIPFDRCGVVSDNAGLVWYQISFIDGRGSIQAPFYDVIHLKNMNFDGLAGQRTVDVHAPTVGPAAASQDYVAGWFGRGAHPSSVAIYNGTLNAQERKDLAKVISDGHAGENTGRTMVLDNLLDFKTIQENPVQSALIEFENLNVEAVSRMTGVPVSLLAHLVRATNATVYQMSTELVLYCLAPWITALQEELTTKLFRGYEIEDGYCYEFDYSSLLLGDSQSLADLCRTLISNGIMTTNEVRAKYFGLNPIDGGDKLLIQMNMTTVNLVGSAAGDVVHEELSPSPAPSPAPSDS